MSGRALVEQRGGVFIVMKTEYDNNVSVTWSRLHDTEAELRAPQDRFQACSTCVYVTVDCYLPASRMA